MHVKRSQKESWSTYRRLRWSVDGCPPWPITHANVWPINGNGENYQLLTSLWRCHGNGWPTAASACSSAIPLGRSLMPRRWQPTPTAPEDTSTTRWPSLRILHRVSTSVESVERAR